MREELARLIAFASVRRAIVLWTAAVLLASCSPTITTSPVVSSAPTDNSQAPATSGPPSEAPTPSAVAVATEEPIPACIPDPTGTGALMGIVEQRPEGWTMLSNGFGLDGFPDLQWQVYGPAGPEVPLQEGPGRLVLYESFPARDAYFKSRAAMSRDTGGTAVEVTVCGDPTELWTNPASGELLVGWTYRGKSDVLVANVADFTAPQLIESAERIYDCCG